MKYCEHTSTITPDCINNTLDVTSNKLLCISVYLNKIQLNSVLIYVIFRYNNITHPK